MKHKFDCYFSTNQGCALNEFTLYRDRLEKMHGCKIKPIRMYKPFPLSNWHVEYELVEEKT